MQLKFRCRNILVDLNTRKETLSGAEKISRQMGAAFLATRGIVQVPQTIPRMISDALGDIYAEECLVDPGKTGNLYESGDQIKVVRKDYIPVEKQRATIPNFSTHVRIRIGCAINYSVKSVTHEKCAINNLEGSNSTIFSNIYISSRSFGYRLMIVCHVSEVECAHRCMGDVTYS